MIRNKNRVALALVIVAFVAPLARAAAISSVASTSSSTTWNTASIWSNSAAPSAGNTYESAHILRTAASFAGDSLTVNTNGVVALKPATTNISNLHMNGGSIQNYYADNQTATLGGTLYIDAPTSISTGTGAGRIDAIASVIYGNQTITTSAGGASAGVSITGTDNPFTGDWVINSGLFKAVGSNSLGSGDITINAGARFDADYHISSPAAMLTLLGQMVLDKDLSFASISINGTPLAVGTYTFAELNTAFDAQFVDGGTGSLTVVVPEPAGLGLTALSMLLWGRRRGRTA